MARTTKKRKRSYHIDYKQRAFKIVAGRHGIACELHFWLLEHNMEPCCYSPYNMDNLTLDHKNGDGAIHRKKIRSGTQLYGWVIKHPKRAQKTLQILCYIANSSSWKRDKTWRGFKSELEKKTRGEND